MTLESFCGSSEIRFRLRNCGQQFRVTRGVSVQQSKQADFHAPSAQLTGHFESDCPTQGSAADKVRPQRLQLADLLYVMTGHLSNARVQRSLSIETLRLQTI